MVFGVWSCSPVDSRNHPQCLFMSLTNHPQPGLALIGVTGYGSIYWSYIRELLATGKVRLVSAVVINPDAAQCALAEMSRHGTRVYLCYEEMMAAEAGKVDLCLIPTGIAWHARMTVAALAAGMNVLVEKPLAGSLADVGAIREAEARSGRWVAVGFQDMYCEEARWLKSILCDGGIGPIRRVRMVGLWPRATSYFARNHWAGKIHADDSLVHDSPLNNAFAHFVNLCFFLSGPERTVSSQVRPTDARLWRAHSIETFDTALVRAESSEGVTFEFFVSHSCPVAREPEIWIEGTGGTAEWHHEGPIGVFREGMDPIYRDLPGIVETRRSMFEAALRKLVDPTAFICTTEMAEAHTMFIDALHRQATIQDIHPEDIEWTPQPDGSHLVPVVRGIDLPFQQVFVNGTGGRGFLRQPGLFEQLTTFEPLCREPLVRHGFPVRS